MQSGVTSSTGWPSWVGRNPALWCPEREVWKNAPTRAAVESCNSAAPNVYFSSPDPMLFISCQRLSKSQFHSIFTGPIVPGLPASSPLSVFIVVGPSLSRWYGRLCRLIDQGAATVFQGRVRHRRSTATPCRDMPPSTTTVTSRSRESSEKRVRRARQPPTLVVSGAGWPIDRWLVPYAGSGSAPRLPGRIRAHA